MVPEWIYSGEDPEEVYEKALQEIGFKVLTIDTHKRKHTFGSKAEAMGKLIGHNLKSKSSLNPNINPIQIYLDSNI